MSFSLTQIIRRRVTLVTEVVAAEVDDLTALAAAVGVLAKPAALAAGIALMTSPSNAARPVRAWAPKPNDKEMGPR
jgi:hypothetical protein